MITQSEVTGISSDDFTTIADSTDALLRQLIVQRYNPVFTEHDSNFNTAFQFSVAANDSLIVRALTDTANLRVDTLAVESDVQGTLNSWSSSVAVEALHSPSIINVKCVRQSSAWDVFFQRSTGKIGRAHSTDGVSWSVSDFSSHVLPLDTSLEWIAYGGGSIEMIYYVTLTDQNSHWLQALDTAGNNYDTGIYWHENFSGMDCEEIIDSSTDSTSTVTGENIRHILTFSAILPGYFTYQNSNGLPVQVFIESGGIISFVVRPPVTSAYRPIMVSEYHSVRHFDRVSAINYRHTCHLTSMNSIFDPSNNRDMLWLAALGEDGDFNTTDTSIGYQALYYYNSRDGINWSQDRIVPIDGIPDFGHYATGVQLVKCGHYIYLLSAQTTLRSPLPAEFGPVVHPDLQLDVTPYIDEYTSSQSDMRTTQIYLENVDAHFNKTMLGQPGTFVLITKLGKIIAGVNYLFQTAIEHIDTIQFIRQRPKEQAVISARDRMSWLTDKSQSTDAIQFDNQISGLDNFAPTVSSSADSGLSHTAVVAGSFATVDHKLHLSSKYKEGISFNTFATSIADGAIDIEFWLPNPTARDTSGGPINGTATPTYAGIVYRAIDKDNFWFVIYDFFAQAFNIGYRLGGSNISLGFYDPGSWFNGQAITENYMTMHVEFRYSKIKLWIKLADGKLHNLVDQLLPGQGPGFTPFMQGYVGVIGAGWSDEDTGTPEPGPIVPVIDPTTIDDLSPFGDTGTDDPTAPAPYPVGTVVKLSGENVFSASSTHSFWLKNFIALATPQHTDNTPGTFSGWAIQAVLVKPNPATTSAAGYVLAYNSGTNKSAVWRTVSLTSPVWVKGADQDGLYTIIRATNVPGSIMIGNPVVGNPVAIKVTFDGGSYPYTIMSGVDPGYGATVGPAQAVVSGGNPGNCLDSGDGSAVFSTGVWIEIHLATPITVTNAMMDWKKLQAYPREAGLTVAFYDASHALITLVTHTVNSPDNTWATWDLGTLNIANVSYVDFSSIAYTITGLEEWIDNCQVSSGDSVTALSSNDGATFSAPVRIGGASNTIMGFDVSRNSATCYATCYGKVRKATSLGGSYSDFAAFTGASPVCAIVPYFRRGSDTADQTAASDPDVVVALDGVDSGGGTLYWVNGTTGVKTNITPVPGIIFDNPNCITTHYGTHIAVFGKVSGTYRLYASTNAGATWTLVKVLTSPTFIRGRRTNPYTTRGQIYLADNGSMWYSSHWGAFGMFIRHMPAAITCFDTVW